jgi:hypothetical protein
MSTTFDPSAPVDPHATKTSDVPTCSWCRHSFGSVPELLDHVVASHLDDFAAA